MTAYYIFKHNNEEIRSNSRSGGAFYAVAYNFIKDGGIVYGCIFDLKSRTAKHIAVDNEKELKLLQGSKYVQSDSADAIADAIDKLSNGKKVLFSGTSCQVEGMINACPKKFRNNLFTIDIVCHGIPSPLILKAWLKSREKELGEEITGFNFRNKKEYGWAAAMESVFTAQNRYDSNIYSKLFYGHNTMRPCCYTCKYRSLKRISDITIADAWGVEKDRPDFNDNMGVSLILVNTEMGDKLINNADMQILKVNIKNYMQAPFNSAAYRPAERDCFWKKFENGGIKAAIKFDVLGGIYKVERKFRKLYYKIKGGLKI